MAKGHRLRVVSRHRLLLEHRLWVGNWHGLLLGHRLRVCNRLDHLNTRILPAIWAFDGCVAVGDSMGALGPPEGDRVQEDPLNARGVKPWSQQRRKP